MRNKVSQESKNKYFVVESPIGKFAKIRKKHLRLLDETWRIVPQGRVDLYKKNGKLQEKAEGLMEITHPYHLDRLTDDYLYDTGKLIGKIVGL
jgi:hypothetical protein